MTNNQICNVLGCSGCGIACWCFGLMFFGVSIAIWGVLLGIIMMILSLTNYD